MRQIVLNSKMNLGTSISKWTFYLGALFLFAFGLGLFWAIGHLVSNVTDTGNDFNIEQPAPFILSCDYLLKGGTIVDGTGLPAYVGDVAIKGDKILAVGKFNVLNPVKTIDITGKTVAPGFIDIHTHTENYWLTFPAGKMTLAQGITTHIAGNCGTSVASVPDFLASINKNGNAINVGIFTGYTKLRRQAGVADNAITNEAQLKKMQALLKKSIEGGSFGMSVGLGYFPQSRATTAELKALGKTMVAENALLAMHIRNEADTVVESLAEAIEIAKVTGVRFEYSHVKAAGENNWNKAPTLLKMLEQAKADGVDIMADAYAYAFSSNDLYSGAYLSSSEENVKKILMHPMVMVASDGGLQARGIAVHPRVYANATRVLGKYVRDENVLTLENAVHKMTQMPAERLKLNDRGLLMGGYRADVVVFDLQDIKENATRTKPNQLSSGMSYVFVNGVIAIDNGNFTGKKGGQALYSNKYYK